jgi:hypothetical protein
MLLLAASRSGLPLLALGAPGSTESASWGLAYSGPLQPDRHERTLQSPRRQIMKLILIVLGLLATTGVVYAACIFC